MSIAALGLVRMALAGAAAADLDDSSLRGSLSNVFSSTGYSRWDGVNFGVHVGVANMDTDFGNSTGPKVAYILRNTTVEKEYSPSSWTTLSSNVTSGRSYGAFLGYNVQWDQFVVGFDAAYNRVSGMETSASDSIGRQFKTSDGFYNDVTVSGQSTIKLLDYASLRGRAGYAFDQFLPYAVLGGAVGRFNYTNSATVKASGTDASGGGGSDYSINQTLTDNKNNAIVAGFVAALGMDVAILPQRVPARRMGVHRLRAGRRGSGPTSIPAGSALA